MNHNEIILLTASQLDHTRRRVAEKTRQQQTTLEISIVGSPTFGNGTVTTRTLLDCPVVARYLVSWGRFY